MVADTQVKFRRPDLPSLSDTPHSHSGSKQGRPPLYTDEDIDAPLDTGRHVHSPFYGGPSRRAIDIASDPLPVNATLRERLDVWRAAPGGRGGDDVEPGQFVQWSLERCSNIARQTNEHMVKTFANTWGSTTRESLHALREELITYMEGLIDGPELRNTGNGTGIVFVAGNADTLLRTKWAVQMLRSSGCSLPVEIACFPEEAPGEDDAPRRELAEMDAIIRPIAGEKKKPEGKSYHLKALAVIQSPFQHVLYLDSDSVPAVDPAYMFDAPSYKRLGFYLTPDYWKTSAVNPLWAVMGVACRDEWEVETGQVLVDKARHLDVFHLLAYMMRRHETWFRFSDGDKDLFRFAMLMLRKRWAVPERWIAAGGLPGDTLTGWCGLSMVQSDPWGMPAFVHYNLLKHVPSGVGRGFSWGRQKQMPLFDSWPAKDGETREGMPATEPEKKEDDRWGDIDCDMLADADDYGTARAPAPERTRRRAARERGAKAFVHGGSNSAFCIGLESRAPRSPATIEADRAAKSLRQKEYEAEKARWAAEVERLRQAGTPESELPPEPQNEDAGEVDWDASPIEDVEWKNMDQFRDFEQRIYDFGFEPSAKGL
ncbi:hypothetical protein A1Q1_07959 [Trichosporon asahii var. asahii CBS 2479]|uniref:Mannosyltransferase putative-domain-containing protein n=1 Tax=Trichosporon asahii var. asahii (strain ATCC 90039 / CBS 2479 / JCM 2466 / KCTC 7840 / NBRC 103889/ NCYC 2677 / UAMH 7654) TaxID=1186058 RepID=J5TGS7_TRIAS|nr:hypothetical protein A1Q1_07959 [Trichosporon asahii var. asahii CBS 2479]EJT50851.1 hypothetical protein A1Q1_07959 [Trichosporon asahii var. asahii CBS 2479]